MTKKRNVTHWILLLDLLCIGAALGLACYLHQLQSVRELFARAVLLEWWPVLVAALSCWTVLYCTMHLDGFSRGWSFPTMLSQVSLGVATLTVLLFAFAFLSHYSYSRLVLVMFGCSVFVGFVAIRCSVSLFLRSHSRHGATRRIVIVGNGKIAQELARKINRHPELMCEIIGFLFPGNGDRPVQKGISTGLNGGTSVPTVGVVELLRANNVDVLLVALPDGSAVELKKLVALCREAGIGISLVPQWYELYVSKAHLIDLEGLPMLSLVEHRPSVIDFSVKRAMDLTLGSICFLLASPLLVIAGAALLLRKGSAFKVETRCGRHGRVFRMYRLNVDRDHPETLAGMERILAQFSLTEVPQLWNVIRGDMTLVGPRPESPERVRNYSDWQRQRLTVSPGLTGLAQVNGLRDEHSSEEKARFDLQYIYQWSPFLDLSIVLQTCWTLAFRFWSPGHLAITPSQPEQISVPPLTLSTPEGQYADRSHSCAD